jgi:hypothetical protein
LRWPTTLRPGLADNGSQDLDDDVSVLRDTIQPFPTFSEAFLNALAELG